MSTVSCIACAIPTTLHLEREGDAAFLCSRCNRTLRNALLAAEELDLRLLSVSRGNGAFTTAKVTTA